MIIDEEQKFGVNVKDKLKTIRANIDTLTLTATPIPRTLQFSLMGARALSSTEGNSGPLLEASERDFEASQGASDAHSRALRKEGATPDGRERPSRSPKGGSELPSGTPPPNRYPVSTMLQPYDEVTIRGAIEYELSRGGQVQKPTRHGHWATPGSSHAQPALLDSYRAACSVRISRLGWARNTSGSLSNIHGGMASTSCTTR